MNAVSRYLRPVASVASIALFVYLLHQTGLIAVLENIRVVGWGCPDSAFGRKTCLAGTGMELLRSDERTASICARSRRAQTDR
jgi:hypothetical protein